MNIASNLSPQEPPKSPRNVRHCQYPLIRLQEQLLSLSVQMVFLSLQQLLVLQLQEQHQLPQPYRPYLALHHQLFNHQGVQLQIIPYQAALLHSQLVQQESLLHHQLVYHQGVQLQIISHQLQCPLKLLLLQCLLFLHCLSFMKTQLTSFHRRQLMTKL